MNLNIIPMPHADPWVDLLRAYVAETAVALAGRGNEVRWSWLDPRDPRDATIVFGRRVPGAIRLDVAGLVWDEESGWRLGDFVDGAPGRRTELSDLVYLGGGVLPEPATVTGKIMSGATGEFRIYRSFADSRDGLDDALRSR